MRTILSSERRYILFFCHLMHVELYVIKIIYRERLQINNRDLVPISQ